MHKRLNNLFDYFEDVQDTRNDHNNDDFIGIVKVADMYSKFLRCRLMNRGGKPLSPTGLPQVIHSIFTKLCNNRRLRAWYKFRTLSDAIGICGVQ